MRRSPREKDLPMNRNMDGKENREKQERDRGASQVGAKSSYLFCDLKDEEKKRETETPHEKERDKKRKRECEMRMQRNTWREPVNESEKNRRERDGRG